MNLVGGGTMGCGYQTTSHCSHSKLACQITCFCSESHEGCNYTIVMERFQSKTPIVSSRAINKDEGIFITTNRHAVAKINVNVDYAQIFRRCTINGLPQGALGMVVQALIEAGNLPLSMNKPSFDVEIKW